MGVALFRADHADPRRVAHGAVRPQARRDRRTRCLATDDFLLAPLPFLPISLEAKRAIFISIIALSGVLAVIGHNAWVTWMGNLVPPTIRGRFFGHRTALCLLGGTLASLATGALVDAARLRGTVSVTLSAFACVGALTGILATYFMQKQHDPPGACTRGST